MNKGLLISFEGLDGSGKSTQMKLLEDWLKSRQIAYVRTREPGKTGLGAEIRHLLLYRPELEIIPLAETFLFQADRAQHFAKIVLPALQEGKVVITHRCFDASIAYQGHARGVGVPCVEELSMLATQEHVPDLTVLLDLDPNQVHKRKNVTEGPYDKVGMVRQMRLFRFQEEEEEEKQSRFDKEEEEFHRCVREGFLQYADSKPDRIKVIEASLSVMTIHRQVIKWVEPLLEEQSLPSPTDDIELKGDKEVFV